MRLPLITLISLLGLTAASPITGVVTVREAAPIAVPEIHPISSPAGPLTKRETALNAFLALLLDYLPDIDGSINAVTGVLTAFEQFLALITGTQTTYNELGGTCKAYTVIFARGTTEPGNVGILVGPPLFSALKTKVGSSVVTIQGVNNYEADVSGYLEGGDAGGSAMMAQQIAAAKTACPNTKLVASGYSQGGQIVHNAAALLPAATAAWISKVVLFGDPYNGTAIKNVAASKVKTFCNVGDNICVNGDLILPPHLLYGENAVAAAAFVAS